MSTERGMNWGGREEKSANSLKGKAWREKEGGRPGVPVMSIPSKKGKKPPEKERTHPSAERSALMPCRRKIISNEAVLSFYESLLNSGRGKVPKDTLGEVGTLSIRREGAEQQ